MRRISWLSLAVLIPLTGLFLTAPGCGKKTETPAKKPDAMTDSMDDTMKKSSAAAEPIEPGKGVIKGKVTFAGDPPPYEVLKALKEAKDKCVAPDALKKYNVDQRYLVDENKGIANVVVVLSAPKGKYFAINDEIKKKVASDPVVIDQPYCAFTPHVSVAFPQYNDGGKLKKTGQKLIVKNSAKFSHNTQLKIGFDQFNPTLTPGEEKEFTLEVQDSPFTLSCSIHAWMNAYIWAFSHPYAAVTDEHGNFEIKNVPTGMEVTLKAWHETDGWFADRQITVDNTSEVNDLVVPAPKK